MQKLVGCFLILLATTGAGWMYGKELRNYLEELSHFRRIIEQIKGEFTVCRTSAFGNFL